MIFHRWLDPDYDYMPRFGGGGSTEIPETEQEIALSEVVTAQWERYKEAFVPIEDEYLANIERTPADESLVTGQISAGVGDVFDKETAAAERDLFASSVRPGSGKFKAAVGGLGIDRAKVSGTAQARGAQGVDDATIIDLQNAIAMGRGEATEATRDMTTLASEATREAIDRAYDKADRRDTVGSGAMTAAGMGLAGWKNLRE